MRYLRWKGYGFESEAGTKEPESEVPNLKNDLVNWTNKRNDANQCTFDRVEVAQLCHTPPQKREAPLKSKKKGKKKGNVSDELGIGQQDFSDLFASNLWFMSGHCECRRRKGRRVGRAGEASTEKSKAVRVLKKGPTENGTWVKPVEEWKSNSLTKAKSSESDQVQRSQAKKSELEIRIQSYRLQMMAKWCEKL